MAILVRATGKPHQQGGLLAAADGEDGSAELRIAGDEEPDKDHDNRDQRARREEIGADDVDLRMRRAHGRTGS